MTAMPKRNGEGIALLADPIRRQIVALLAIKPHQPSDLARALSLSRPAMARQLRLLQDAGLVIRHQAVFDRRAALYTLNSWRHGHITAWLAGTEVGRSFADAAEAAGIPADRFRGSSQQAEPTSASGGPNRRRR